jgi:phosphinothricin acetyltransferase
MFVREATPADLPALLEIYNEAVINTTASWDHDPWTAVRHADWYAHKAENGFPILVADQDGEVLGYATYSEFSGKAGYTGTREHNVYLRVDARRRGIGRTLMEALIDQARARGVHTLIGRLSADNEASLRLHAGLGFVEVGRLHEVGRKFGRWLDLVYLQLMLQD